MLIRKASSKKKKNFNSLKIGTKQREKSVLDWAGKNPKFGKYFGFKPHLIHCITCDYKNEVQCGYSSG